MLADVLDLDLKVWPSSLRFRKAILHFESAEHLRLPVPESKADTTLLVVLYHGLYHAVARLEGHPPS
jgi:hypothetical protein